MNFNFDAYAYFQDIRDKNKLAAYGNYKFSRVTGLSNMEEVIAGSRKEKAFFCVDDTEDGVTLKKSGGYFQRRSYTVFVLKKYKSLDMGDQHDALLECRKIYEQVLKKLIKDKDILENSMVYLLNDRIPFHEIPGHYINGCTGLYFIVTIEIPTDLRYQADEWLS